MQNREQVASKFLFGRLLDVVENHEFSAVALDKPSDEFVPKSAKAVFVGNHNLLDISFDCRFQYGSKTFSFEIEPRTNVFDDFVFWVFSSHEFDLAVKIVSLLGTGYSTVADSSSSVEITDKGINVVETLS